jgi:predicted DNA-binding transcriptional regulator AlpA
VLTVSEVVRYLSITEFAARAGLSRNTLKSYSLTPGRLPEPDAMVGHVRGWLPETVEAWIAGRTTRR